MDLRKVALYLSYIAFCLERETTETKTMKQPAPTATEQYVADINGGKPETSPEETEQPEEEKERKPKGCLVTNPAVVALSRISDILDELDDDEVQRVMLWLMIEHDIGYVTHPKTAS